MLKIPPVRSSIVLNDFSLERFGAHWEKLSFTGTIILRRSDEEYVKKIVTGTAIVSRCQDLGNICQGRAAVDGVAEMASYWPTFNIYIDLLNRRGCIF